VVITCTHIGNWELAAVVLAQWGYALHAVAGVQLSRWLTPAVRETKSELAIHTVAPEDGFRSLIRALEHNDLVALMVDGDIFSHGVRLDLFGREVAFPSGPGMLAQRTGALILCGYCERVGPGRFRIVMEPPLDPAGVRRHGVATAAVAEISERHIRDISTSGDLRPPWDPAPVAAWNPAVPGASRRGDRHRRTHPASRSPAVQQQRMRRAGQ
jgi:KDO2-lipid IV(A) lauroyltransferase